MTKITTSFANAVLTKNKQAVHDIHLPSKNVAVYQRDIAPLQSELAQIMTKSIECRANGSAEDVLATLQDFFVQRLPHCPTLLKDVSELFKLFKVTTRTASFRLLLTTISTNMCRKFHTDINDLRLLCTYIGPGTIWLPDEAVDFEALQSKSSAKDVVKNPELVQQVQTGEVIILKGALYPEARPILHRSPIIEEAGINRLLLRIDTNANQNLWM